MSCRVSEGSVMMSVANTSTPVGVLSHNSLVVPMLGLTHQEFVQKVQYYHSIIIAMVMLLGTDL